MSSDILLLTQEKNSLVINCSEINNCLFYFNKEIYYLLIPDKFFKI